MMHLKKCIIGVVCLGISAFFFTGCGFQEDSTSEVSVGTDSQETDITEIPISPTDIPTTTPAEISTEESSENSSEIEEQNSNSTEEFISDENTATATDREATDSLSGNIRSKQGNSIFVEIDDGSGDYPIYEFNVINADTNIGGVIGSGINNLKSGLNVNIQYYVENNINYAVEIDSDGEEYMPPSIIAEQNELYGGDTDSEITETDDSIADSEELDETIQGNDPAAW